MGTSTFFKNTEYKVPNDGMLNINGGDLPPGHKKRFMQTGMNEPYTPKISLVCLWELFAEELFIYENLST